MDLLPAPIEYTVQALVIVLTALFIAARKFPHAEWLRPFRIHNRLTEPQRERLRRSSNRNAGAQLILLGISLPLGYLALTIMFFNSVKPVALAFVIAGSVLCVGLGAWALVSNR